MTRLSPVSTLRSTNPDPQHIVVRSVNWLGDAVMTTPALRRLRQRFPSARIELLTPAKLADLWTGHPDLDGILAFQKGDNVLAVARQLRERRFDLAILFPNSHRVALEAWCARIPRRFGIARPWRNLLLNQVVESPAGIATTRKRTPEEIQSRLRNAALPPEPAPGPESHHTAHYLRLVAGLGADPTPVAPFLTVSTAEQNALRRRWDLDPQRTWVGINPGAEYGAAKRWPAANFAASARLLAAEGNRGFLLFGGPADRTLAEGIAAEIGSAAPVRILAGKTSLRELCTGLSICSVVLTNDTGPMHVAAAVGTPVVVPFGSTSIELTGPGLPGETKHRLLRPSNAPCAPCFLRECPIDFRCMASHTVERVTQSVREVLAERNPT